MTQKILIVEDNAMNMKLFVDVLEVHGFEAIPAPDGAQAVAMARMHKPDVILMDIQLPGMDGRDITRAIKADPDLAHIPVVAVTACTMRGDEDSLRAAGCVDYIAKPFSLPHLLETVRRYAGPHPKTTNGEE
jgi:two-component system, cell cycle response regulator DivK